MGLKTTFLKDVLSCSLGAYGGPEAHYGVFASQLVDKKAYVTQEELQELIALTALLPGPSSTQTITAIGYRLGGPWLAFLTLMVWALPVLSVMTLMAVLGRVTDIAPWREGVFSYIGPMALGFVFYALYKMIRLSAQEPKRFMGVLVVAPVVYFFPSFILYLGVMLGLGLLTLVLDRVPLEKPQLKEKPLWGLLGLFGFFLVLLPLLALSGDIWWVLADRFYRFGASVIGGGQVLIPYMVQTLVNTLEVITYDTFIIGYGLVQGLPGPMFSFTAFVGGEAAASLSLSAQVGTALISGLMIFLPGTLLIFFVAPLWQNVRGLTWIQSALRGVRLGAIALISVTWIQLAQQTSWSPIAVSVTTLSVMGLGTKKIPAPLIVAATLALGWFLL